MNVVQKNRYFFTHTNLYAVSDMAEKIPTILLSMMQQFAPISQTNTQKLQCGFVHNFWETISVHYSSDPAILYPFQN